MPVPMIANQTSEYGPPTSSIRILLIEDHESDGELIKRNLHAYEEKKCSLIWVRTLSEGTQHIETGSPIDLVLLDLSLPDSYGLPTLSSLLERKLDIPIVVLTGDVDESRGVEAVKMGAQDYLIKGEALNDTLMRSLSFALERHHLAKKGGQASQKSTDEFFLKSGPIEIDLKKIAVSVSKNETQHEMDLTPNEFKIFVLLFDNLNSVVSRSRIVAEVWGDDNSAITLRTVDRHMSTIKRKFEPHGISIQTIYGVGYKLDLPESP